MSQYCVRVSIKYAQGAVSGAKQAGSSNTGMDEQRGIRNEQRATRYKSSVLASKSHRGRNCKLPIHFSCESSLCALGSWGQIPAEREKEDQTQHIPENSPNECTYAICVDLVEMVTKRGRVEVHFKWIDQSSLPCFLSFFPLGHHVPQSQHKTPVKKH